MNNAVTVLKVYSWVVNIKLFLCRHNEVTTDSCVVKVGKTWQRITMGCVILVWVKFRRTPYYSSTFICCYPLSKFGRKMYSICFQHVVRECGTSCDNTVLYLWDMETTGESWDFPWLDPKRLARGTCHEQSSVLRFLLPSELQFSGNTRSKGLSAVKVLTI